MSETMIIPFRNNGGTPGDNATLLLAAAEELGLDGSVVRTVQDGFRAPVEVAEKAFGKAKAKAMAEPTPEPAPEPAKKAAAKKAPAKKATKKAPAKKAPAKKAAKKSANKE